MKSLLVVLLAVLPATSFAARGDATVRGIIGLESSAFTVGGDFERTGASSNFGGYFILATKKEKNNVQVRPQTIAFGVTTPIHLIDNKNNDVILAPGFGIAMVDKAPNGSSETIFGPVLRSSAEHKFDSFSLGVDYTMQANFFNENVGSPAQTFNIVVGFAL